MTERTRHEPRGTTPSGDPPLRQRAHTVRNVAIFVVVLGAAAAGGWLTYRAIQPATPAPHHSGSPPASPASAADFQPLVGDWARDDGDYMLRIGSVAPDGKADTVYLNPNPIHVAEAKASKLDGRVALFVKLQDQGYPGSAYTLTYNAAAADTLAGDYFQAAVQRNYHVVFRRVRR